MPSVSAKSPPRTTNAAAQSSRRRRNAFHSVIRRTKNSSGVHVSHARGTLGVAGPLPAVPASAFGSGLTVTYYGSNNLSGPPIATGTVPNLDYTGAPAAVAGHPVWSARYTAPLPPIPMHAVSLNLSPRTRPTSFSDLLT